MPASSKRARTITQEEENPLPTPPPTSARHTRRTSAATSSILTPSTAAITTTAPPSPPTTTPTRPIQTRSSTLHLAPPTPLTRTSSLFSPTTRRTPTAGSSLSSLTPSRAAGSAGPSRGGTLVRTQSTPTLTSPADLKQGIASGSGGGGRGKGDPEDAGDGPGRRFGKGKENVPPKKDAGREDGENSSRKRLRVSPRASASGSASGRGRSGSVASVRSESSSGPNSLFSRRSTMFPSPSPSPSQSADSASSIDPLDILQDDMDIEKTPTKRPMVRRGFTLPTPPSSSPSMNEEVDATGRRMQLVRMNSTLSTISTATETGSDIAIIEEGTPIKAKNAYKYLKSFLRLSSTTAKAISADVVGREDEKAVLRSYFSLRSSLDVGLYVSGPPGTGKTALVSAIGREMAQEGWNVVEVGCMGVKTGNIWTLLAEQLGCDRSEEGVQAAFAQVGKNTLIILDEVDSLLPPSPALPTPATSHLLSRLFSLPLLSNASSTIKFIAISNTLDLTVRARLVLPTGTQPQVLPFRAYGTAEMIDIVNSRVAAAAVGRSEVETVKVDLKAIELLTRKVEAQNGDLRTCLASLTTAVSLAEAEWVKKTFTLESDTDAPVVPLVKIALPHIIKAFTSHTQQLKAAAGSSSSSTGSPTARKIRSVPLQGKMVLVSILIYLSRSRAGLPGCPSASSTASTPTTSPHKHGDLSTSTLYATYSYLLSHTSSPFPPAPESDYRDLLSNLETLGLVALYGNGSLAHMSRSSSAGSSRTKAGAAGPRVELCVPEEEVRQGLGLGAAVKSGGGGMADEEVGKVWEREEARVVKAREKLARAVDILAGIERDE